MITTNVAATVNEILLALSPIERWQGARQLSAEPSTVRWFFWFGVASIIVLGFLFLAISYFSKKLDSHSLSKSFKELSNRSGLSGEERALLEETAKKAGLKRYVTIFNLRTAFERGVRVLIQDNLKKSKSMEDRRYLQIMLSFLREKLGFQKRFSSSTGPRSTSKSVSTNQIPAGKTLSLFRHDGRESVGVDVVVVKNDEMGLSVELDDSSRISCDELWSVRYYFGGSIWEFDSTVMGVQERQVLLSHSYNIRFINRRRFLRVSVNRPAFVARFPFMKTIEKELSEGSGVLSVGSVERASQWGPPSFVPALITELAGPGLRIEVPFKPEMGERILVIFELEQKQRSSGSGEDGDITRIISKIIQDVGIVEELGEVKRAEENADSFSIAVELTTLSDSDVDELIRATNKASITARQESESKAQGSVSLES